MLISLNLLSPFLCILIFFYLCFSSSPLAPGCPSTSPASSSPQLFRVLQWNASGLRTRSTKLLHSLLSHSVDLICIQESNLNSSSSFRIPGFSALHSDRTHSRSGILSHDATHASSGVVIFVKQGLSFSELSTSLSSLNPYSDYVGVNISLNNSSSVSFLNVYAPYLLLPNGWQNQFLLSLNSFLLQKSLHSGGLQLPSPLWDSRGTSNPCGEEVFDWVISSDLFPLNDPDTPTILHRISGSRSSPDISFSTSSLSLSCSWEVLQDLDSDHVPILLSVPSLRSFAPMSVPLPSTFRKLAGMTLPCTLTLTVLLQRNTHLFLLPLLSLPLWH